MRLALLLSVLLAGARAQAQTIAAWGFRGGTLLTGGAMNKYFGTGLGTFEGYIQVPFSNPLYDLEVSMSGYAGSSVEQGTVNCGGACATSTTGYQYTQNLTVIPILTTFEVGPQKDWGRLKAGAGVGVYYATLSTTFSLADQAGEAAFGQSRTITTTAAGPHVQVSGDYFLTKHLGVGFFARYAYARLNENFSRFLQSATPSTLNFSETDRAGNIAGFTFGAGLALRI